MDFKKRMGVLVVAMFIAGMAIISSVTACSDTPQNAWWGYKYIETMTIEDYGDLVGYASSVCTEAGTVAIGCAALREPRAAGICALIVAGLPCASAGALQWDYTDKNRWLRKNCDSSDTKLVDAYGRDWWNLFLPPSYTNARCGC